MRKILYKSGTSIGLALLSSAAFAAPQEELLTTILGQVQMYVFIAFVIIVAAGVYFMRSRDKRQTPLNKIFEKGEAIYSVGPDTPVTECVRLMTAGKIGALIVMEGGRLIGIFTERDALNKVLAGGLDPGSTKVSEVMTRDPYFISPTTTVGDAMKLITKRRFRHLPIVDNGKRLVPATHVLNEAYAQGWGCLPGNDVRFGSKADKPFGVKIQLCPLLSESGH